MASSTLLGNITKLAIPRKLVEKSNGFAIDIGGSVVKIVYLSKKEWDKEGKKDQTSEQTNLYMTSCAKDDVEDAIKFIKEHVYIKSSDSGEVPAVYTTGVGCNQMAKRLNNELNIRILNTIEFDDFALATNFLLDNFPVEQALADFPMQGFRKGFQRLLTNFKGVEAWMIIPNLKAKVHAEKVEWLRPYCEDVKGKLERGDALLDTSPQTYPYILGQFGSAFVFLKVEEDCTYTLLDVVSLGGRTFLDLGSLLTGAKNYVELMALAECGNANNLNVKFGESLGKEKDDSYSIATDNENVIYSFGKAHGLSPDEISKADLARTLLQNICLNAMRIAYQVMLGNKCTDLVLTGSFAGSHLNQQILAEEFEYLRTEYANLCEPDNKVSDFRLRTIRQAGQLGALGSFLHGCE